MKKFLSILLSLLLLVGTCSLLASCKTDPNDLSKIELDTANSFTDNFDKVDYNNWGIMNSRWGGEHHGGVIPSNIGYTKDGELLITANGDFYDGDKKDVKGNIGKRTGGAITSHKAFTPGVFSARIKALPRFGATTAFWTFFNDGVVQNESGTPYNSEIDFELNVDTFDTTMVTNWVGAEPSNCDTRKIQSKFYHNDGAWHEYTFKWYTQPERVEYYVDGEMISFSTDKVPTYAAQINFGVWFAGFAGISDFETDYCFVDWFKYTPFKNQPYTPVPDNDAPSSDKGYPKEPTIIPESVNLVANGSFDNTLYTKPTPTLPNAWTFYPGTDKTRTLIDATVTGSGIDGSNAIVLDSGEEIQQIYTQVYPGYKMDLSAFFKHSATQSGKILIEYMELTDKVVKSEEMIINAQTPGFSANAFYKFSKQITVPDASGKKISRARICYISDKTTDNRLTVDNIFMNHIKA